MKTLSLFFTFIFLTTTLLAAGLKPAPLTDKQDVEQAIEKLRKAIIAADKNLLEASTVKELSYGHSSGKVENQTEFVKAITSGESSFKTIVLTEQTITITGNVAVVRHILSGDTMNSGVAGTTHLSVLQVWLKQNGIWKLLARQAVKV